MPKSKRTRPIRPTEAPLPPLSKDYNQSLIAFALESGRFNVETEKSKRQFWGANIPQLTQGIDPSMVFWADWFMYCRPLKTGLTPLQTFLSAYQGRLTPEEAAAYRKLEQSVFGVFQVNQVQRDQSVTIRDLSSEQVYEVTERRATHQLQVGFIISAHILPLPEGWRFTGALAPWPSKLKEFIPGYINELDQRGSGPGNVRYVPALERARRSAYLQTSNPRHLEQVIALYQRGRNGWARALELLRPMLEQEPFNPIVNFYFGLLAPHDLEEMERRLCLAQSVAPDLTGPRGESIDSHLVLTLESQHKYDQAIAIYRRMIQHDPDDSDAYFNQAQLLTRLERGDEAEGLYRQAIRRFHDDHWGHYCLGTLLQKRGQENEAREQYGLALQKAYWQLHQWPDCIDDEIVREMEGALRSVGGDISNVPPYKPGIWTWLGR
ncbi:MAG: tetratricopeptide repeat protein [Chloroflexi bacterium]|nr:tetratricopeptide repeat protein [Chloroflexota bacterium]